MVCDRGKKKTQADNAGRHVDPRPRATALHFDADECGRAVGGGGWYRGAPQRRQAVQLASPVEADGLAAARSEPAWLPLACCRLKTCPFGASALLTNRKRQFATCLRLRVPLLSIPRSEAQNKLGRWRRGKSFVSGADVPRRSGSVGQQASGLVFELRLVIDLRSISTHPTHGHHSRSHIIQR